MTDQLKKWLGYVIVFAAMFLASYLGYHVAPPVPPTVITPQSAPGFARGVDCSVALGAPGNTNCVTIRNGYDLSAYSDDGTTRKFLLDAATGDVTTSGTLTATGGLVGEPLLTSASITPTQGVALALTANYVTLTPAGALTTTLAACTTGRSAVIYNSVNASVILTDSTTFQSAGNQTLTQYDTLPVACIGSVWVQTGPVSAN